MRKKHLWIEPVAVTLGVVVTLLVMLHFIAPTLSVIGLLLCIGSDAAICQ